MREREKSLQWPSGEQVDLDRTHGCPALYLEASELQWLPSPCGPTHSEHPTLGCSAAGKSLGRTRRSPEAAPAGCHRKTGRHLAPGLPTSLASNSLGHLPHLKSPCPHPETWSLLWAPPTVLPAQAGTPHSHGGLRAPESQAVMQEAQPRRSRCRRGGPEATAAERGSPRHILSTGKVGGQVAARCPARYLLLIPPLH